MNADGKRLGPSTQPKALTTCPSTVIFRQHAFDFVSGPDLLTGHHAEETAQLLRTCFPEFFALSTEKTLREGIGFHDMEDTTWVIVRGVESLEIVGLIVAVIYHNGLYLSNFCVAPAYRNRGLGLDILEVAAQLAIKVGRSRLIGNARSTDHFIVHYYRSLGAQIIQTGLGESGEYVGSVRFVRDIPHTTAGLAILFESIRIQRQQRSRSRQVGRLALGVLAATLVTVGAACLFTRRNKQATTRDSHAAK